MPKQDVVSWTMIVVACGQHGHEKEALELFLKIKHTSIKLYDVTFLGILSTCSHAGLVEEVFTFLFNDSKSHYNAKNGELCMHG